MTKSKKKRREPFTRMDIHERSIIEVRYCTDGKSLRAIARELGRSPNAVREEIGEDREMEAGGTKRFGRRERRMNGCGNGEGKKNLTHPPLMAYVREKLQLGWSPEQIALRLPVDFPDNTSMRVSHETIYVHIYDQISRLGHGTVKAGCEDLRPLLPRRRKRRMTKGMRKARTLERTIRLPSIEDMPEEVKERSVIGHWQGDTLVSRKSTVRVKSVNELTSGVVFFEKTKDGTAAVCNEATVRRLQEVPEKYRRTLLQDRGNENMRWETVEKETGISCYFAHPYASYERGSNENTNGLLRRYFPKGTDFDKIKDRDSKRAEYLINSRPRKRLGGLTPYGVFYHMTGVLLEP